jgi:regulator of RNase E activity RraB
VVSDTSLYDGPSKSQVYDSFRNLYADLIHDLDPFLNRAKLSLIDHWISKFLEGFWKQSKAAISGREIKDLADLCKERRNDLQSVISSFVAGKAPAFPGDFYVVSDNPRKLESLTYYPNSFKALLSYMEELQEVMSFVELKNSPGFYVYLHKITFHLISSFDITEEEYEQNKEKIIILLNLALSLGQVYEHMNPTPEVMEEYGLALLNQLRQESKDPSDEFWSLFEEVAKDINAPLTNSNRYVHDIIRARKRFRRRGIPKFSYSDYYMTAKAATCTVTIDKSKKIKLNALYSSIVEGDPIKDDPRVVAFDNLVGYQSGYLDQYDLPEHIDREEKLVITQMIPNTGKYKPRAIHVGCNSIQDRCKYLHKISADFLNTIESCCMKQHFNGVKFLKKVTSPSYRKEHRNNVFVSDFSNATDTLNQQFQCKVIEVFFNKTFADFWEFISTLPKTFRHPLDNSLEDYIQNTGQPQGLLNSFDAFSDAHIYLICMLMKKFNLTAVELSEVLAIVGDDSIVSYPSELELNSVDGYTFYTFHSWLCEQVSLIKNDSKTGKSFFDDQGSYSHEVLDFAKISIQDGVFVTPIPFGLASAYMNKPGFTDIQLYLWLSSKGITYKELMYRRILKAFYNKPDQLMAVSSVMSSGEVPFLENFQDERLFNSIDSSIRGVSLYTFYLNQLEHTFLSSILSENRKNELNTQNFLDKSLDSLEEDFYKFNSNLSELIGILPENHKYNLMINRNMQIAQDISDLLELGHDREGLSILLGVLTTDEYHRLFKIALEFHDNINEALELDDQNIWMMFCYQDFSIFKELSHPLKNFQVKSMKKVSSNSTIFMKSSALKTHSIIQQSSYLKDCFTKCVSNFIDTFIQVANIRE